MKTDTAIQLAGGAKALAEILEVTPSAISQWGKEIPKAREWQLRVVKPEWFGGKPYCCKNGNGKSGKNGNGSNGKPKAKR
jgi:hypothetical protein